jgi:hypothetical protein
VSAQDLGKMNFRKELRPNLVTSKTNIELLWFVEYDCADTLELSIHAEAIQLFTYGHNFPTN